MKEDKFYPFEGGFIKASFIRQMSGLIVWADLCSCYGYIDGEKHERYVAGLDRVRESMKEDFDKSNPYSK